MLDSVAGRWDIEMSFSDTEVTWGGPGLEATVDQFEYEGETATAIVTVRSPFPGRVKIVVSLTGPDRFEGTAKAKILPPVKLSGTRVAQ